MQFFGSFFNRVSIFPFELHLLVSEIMGLNTSNYSDANA